MKTIFYTLFLISLMSSCCDTGDQVGNTPYCILEAILDFSDEACEQGRVDLYRFQGEMVYVFDTYCCCDYTADVLDSHCEKIGYLGGFAGNTKVNGVEFYEFAEFIETVWQN